jgi:hypothetical protein
VPSNAKLSFSQIKDGCQTILDFAVKVEALPIQGSGAMQNYPDPTRSRRAHQDQQSKIHLSLNLVIATYVFELTPVNFFNDCHPTYT